ncbi:Disease resistance protein L6 [Linum grandiflorum]
MRKLPQLPESGSLEMLDLSNNFGRMDDGAELDVRNLWNLKVAKLQYCKIGKIKGGTIGTTMKELRELDLSVIEGDFDSMRRAISDIGQLSSLEILKVNAAYRTRRTGHDLLKGIKLPKGLRVLITSSGVANLSELLELEELTVIRTETGIVIPENHGWWSSSSKLKSLILSRADMVMATNDSMLPSNLTRFCITDLINSEQLPNLRNLGSLITMQLDWCPKL